MFKQIKPTTIVGLPEGIFKKIIKEIGFLSCASSRSVLVDIRS